MCRLVEEGSVDPRRYVRIGLRGYWSGDEEFAWQKERGITSLFMHETLGGIALRRKTDTMGKATDKEEG